MSGAQIGTMFGQRNERRVSTVGRMSDAIPFVKAALFAGAAAALVLAASQLRAKNRQIADVTQSIEDQLDALDAATREAVVARLTADEVARVRAS